MSIIESPFSSRLGMRIGSTFETKRDFEENRMQEYSEVPLSELPPEKTIEEVRKEMGIEPKDRDS